MKNNANFGKFLLYSDAYFIEVSSDPPPGGGGGGGPGGGIAGGRAHKVRAS